MMEQRLIQLFLFSGEFLLMIFFYAQDAAQHNFIYFLICLFVCFLYILNAFLLESYFYILFLIFIS